MTADTGPAELAEIIEDDRKFRTYMVLSHQRLENKLDSHIADDKRQFDALSSQQSKVTSSVGGLEIIKHRFQGGWATVAVLAVILAFLADLAFKIAEHIK